jgi:hypothetical protein
VSSPEAIADLLEISSQIEAAVLFDAGGTVEASSFADEAAGTALARRALDLVAAAGGVRADGPAVKRVEAILAGGGLVVVREGERLAAATTVAEPPSALVVYDLRTALRSSEPAPPKPRRRRTTKPKTDA